MDFRRVSVALVIRFEDIETGNALGPYSGIDVAGNGGFSLPICKSDGYYVFTGSKVESVSVSSKKYESCFFAPEQDNTPVLRVSLVPKAMTGSKAFPLPLAAGKFAHIGFGGARQGYALAADIDEGSREMQLQKEDLNDITCMWNVLSGQSDEPMFIDRHMGHGRYCLRDPVLKEYAVRGCRVFPLRRVAGNEEGMLNIPARGNMLFLFEQGKPVRRIEIEGG